MSSKPIIQRTDEVLRPLGFFRHKATWNRSSEPFVDVIEIQKSKSGDTVTVNAGVLHPGVHKQCWGTELPAIIQEPECIVRARIGHLVEGKDIWWQLNDPATLNEIPEKLITYVLPFLARMHSLGAMEQFLTAAHVIRQKYPPPIVYLAILKSELDDKPGACALLADLRRQTTAAWLPRVRDVIKRLKCEFY